MQDHQHYFKYANFFFDYERNTKGEIHRCKCGAELFSTVVGPDTFNTYCKNGREYKTETIKAK